ncbi:hypothetical protein A6U92_03250 [Agrobacterium rubi]|nr:hypothetical protein A6U92_03250 [Agrobacterium rubi]
MAEVAEKYRNQFDVVHVELVDIISIIEFKLPELFAGFRLLIKPTINFVDFAVSEPHNNCIIVREDIYDGACQGDAFCRFVLAHELGHFLLHSSKPRSLHKSPENYDTKISNMSSVESAEKQADMFARHFLAPLHLAFRHRENPEYLSEITGVSLDIAKGNISLSKRIEMRDLIYNKIHI